MMRMQRDRPARRRRAQRLPGQALRLVGARVLHLDGRQHAHRRVHRQRRRGRRRQARRRAPDHDPADRRVIWAYLGIVFEILTETVAWERWEGTIEYTFMAPLSRAVHLGGMGVFAVLYGVLRTSLLFAVVALFFGLSFPHADFGAALLLLAVASVSFVGVGMITAVLPLISPEKGAQLGFVAQGLLLVVSGVYYPVDVMPQWMQWLATISPATYALDGIRAAVLDGAGVSDVWRPVAAAADRRGGDPARARGVPGRRAVRQAGGEAQASRLAQASSSATARCRARVRRRPRGDAPGPRTRASRRRKARRTAKRMPHGVHQRAATARRRPPSPRAPRSRPCRHPPGRRRRGSRRTGRAPASRGRRGRRPRRRAAWSARRTATARRRRWAATAAASGLAPVPGRDHAHRLVREPGKRRAQQPVPRGPARSMARSGRPGPSPGGGSTRSPRRLPHQRPDHPQPRPATTRGYSSCGSVATSVSERDSPVWTQGAAPARAGRAIVVLVAAPLQPDRDEAVGRRATAAAERACAAAARRSSTAGTRAARPEHVRDERRHRHAAQLRRQRGRHRQDVRDRDVGRERPHERRGLARRPHRRFVRLQGPLPRREHLVLGRGGERPSPPPRPAAPAPPRLDATSCPRSTSADAQRQHRERVPRVAEGAEEDLIASARTPRPRRRPSRATSGARRAPTRAPSTGARRERSRASRAIARRSRASASRPRRAPSMRAATPCRQRDGAHEHRPDVRHAVQQRPDAAGRHALVGLPERREADDRAAVLDAAPTSASGSRNRAAPVRRRPRAASTRREATRGRSRRTPARARPAPERPRSRNERSITRRARPRAAAARSRSSNVHAIGETISVPTPASR